MKDKTWKLVKNDRYNSDQYLLGFFNSEQHARDNIPYVFRKNSNWIKKEEDILIKPVDPEMIFKPVCTDYMHYVWSLIPKKEQERVMASDSSAEIHCNHLMCGGETYYYLSRMIDEHWTAIDIGASYGAQSYLFKDHKKYIAVEPNVRIDEWHFENFQAEGTERYEMTAGTFINEVLPTLNLDLDTTFAICNYVPSGWHGEDANELVRKTFHNCYVFYPSF